MKKILIITLVAVAVFSCKKDPKTISISGTVTDTYLNTPVSGVKVTLQANGVVEGVYNSSYVTIGTYTTDASGNFDFIVDESAYDSFRFSFLKSGYYYSQEVVSGSLISPEQPYNHEFDFSSIAVVRLHIRNSAPVDNNDKLTISFTNNPIDASGCCSSIPKVFEGMNIDTTVSCNSVGGFNLLLFSTIAKNNSSSSFTDTLYTIPSDTLDVDIFY